MMRAGRRALLLVAFYLLAGCAGPTIYLRHPQTGHSTTCTSSRWKFLLGALAESREECAVKWVKAGYVIDREE